MTAPRAILLDALGTLLELQPPAPALRQGLRERLGIDISAEEAERGVTAEIAYYRAHLQEGHDRAQLARLRHRCAAALRAALPGSVTAAPAAGLIEVLLGALRFEPYPEVPDALCSARALGVRLVVVSNWDVSLHDVMVQSGLAHLVHGTITSAELGVGKPDPVIFRHALTLAGVPAADALHVGDSFELDVAGARAAGIEAVLLRRDGRAASAGVRTIASLRELPSLGL